MALNDSQRSQLDSIVHQATLDGESDQNIQAIVNDFSSKYGNSQQQVTQQSQPATDPYNTLGNKVANFLGIQNRGISQAIAAPFVSKTLQSAQSTRDQVNNAIAKQLNLARQQGDQTKIKKLTQLLTSNGSTPDMSQILGGDKGIASNGEVVGSLINSAALLATPFTSTTKLVPGSVLSPSFYAQNAGNIGKIAAQGAELGGINSLGQSLQQKNANVGSVTKGTLLGSAIGGVAAPVTAVAMQGISNYLEKAAADKYNAAFGVNKNEISKSIKTGQPTVGEQIVSKGGIKPGGLSNILDNQTSTIDTLNQQYQPILDKLDATNQKIDVSQVSKQLNDLANSKAASGPAATSAVNALKAYADYLDGLGGEVSPSQAQAIKIGIYQTLGDKAYAKEVMPSMQDAAAKAAAKINEQLSTLSPELQQLNQQESFHRSVQDVVQRALADHEWIDAKQITKQVVSLLRGRTVGTDVILGGLGEFIGGPAVSAGVVGINRALTSIPGLTARAGADILGSKATQALSGVLPKLAATISGNAAAKKK